MSHVSDNGVECQSEKCHGERATLLYTGGEENREGGYVVYEDCVHVVVVEALYGASEERRETHSGEDVEEEGAGEGREGGRNVVSNDAGERGVGEGKCERFSLNVHDVVSHLSTFEAGLLW